ncbi:MAG: hypothetical protein KAR21_04360, partial [Spirochaetales bacterium]|nr:hypothetical protein [Spirochaetales bacterium]
MYGYAGKILHVDLGTGIIKTEALDKDFARDYVGGLGFGAKIYLDLIKDNPDFGPLSPENPFVLMTGPLTGISMNAVARWTVCSKSPLTGLFSHSVMGGFWGSELKFAGYDRIVIRGKSPELVYLWINNDKVEIRDAS